MAPIVLGLLFAGQARVGAVDGVAPPAPAPAPPASAVVHITDAQDRLLTGELKPAADRLSRANALYAEAMLLSEGPATDQQRALDMYRQTVVLDPSFTEAQIKLASMLLQAGQFDEAYGQLQTLAKAHPDSLPVQVELGYTQKLRGQNEDAQRICARALAADSGQTVAMRVMLEIAAGQDDLAGGVIHVEDILKAGGEAVPASAWLNLDRLYLEYAHGQMNSPVGEIVLRTRLPILQQAAAKPPPDADTLTQLSKTYMGLGRKIDALKTLQRASAIDPDDADLAWHCAELEEKLDQKAGAMRDYEKAFEINPSLPGQRDEWGKLNLDRLGDLYLDNKRFAQAVRLYEKASADAPTEPTLKIDLGIAYEANHEPEKAQACFQDVFDSTDCPPDAYIELAYFQLDRKEYPQAGQTLASAQTHFPESARIRFYEAILSRLEAKYDAALARLGEVRTLASGTEAGVLNRDFYVEDALTLNLAGKKDELEAALREGLGHYPDDAELMNQLAYFWAEQGQHLPEALALSRRAGTLEPDNGPIMDTCGWVYYQMGQAKDALPYLQRAAFMTNNDPVVLQHVGDAYLKLGQRREAIAAWARALEKDPHNGVLASRIDAALAQANNAHSRSAPKP
jgi:tetratricopeptide (TPR) repeat protein